MRRGDGTSADRPAPGSLGLDLLAASRTGCRWSDGPMRTDLAATSPRRSDLDCCAGEAAERAPNSRGRPVCRFSLVST